MTDLSAWAKAIDAAGLEPTDHTLQLGIDTGEGDKPRVRLHFVMTLSRRVLSNL